MTPNLTQYLHHSSALDSISVTEIEELITKAPSADAYRMLLDKKMSRQYTHDTVLAGADKMLLSNLVFDAKHLTQEATTSLQGIIELDPTALAQERLDDIEIIQVTNENVQQKDDLETMSDESILDPITEETFPQDFDLHNSEEPTPMPVGKIENNVDVEETIEDIAIHTGKKNTKKNKQKQKSFKLKEYSGISEYAKWLLAFKKVDVEKQIRKEEKAAKKRALEANAKKSVTKSDQIASEPLAEILAIQGHFDDAKKMYEQLMHKYPEKSSYFAAKINNLLKI